jgi:hypothetical protein
MTAWSKTPPSTHHGWFYVRDDYGQWDLMELIRGYWFMAGYGECLSSQELVDKGFSFWPVPIPPPEESEAGK